MPVEAMSGAATQEERPAGRRAPVPPRRREAHVRRRTKPVRGEGRNGRRAAAVPARRPRGAYLQSGESRGLGVALMATETVAARKTTRRVAIADRGSRSSCVSVNFHAIEQTRRRVDGVESKAIATWTARR